MYGSITDEKGAGLPGATVIATHLPTGTQYAVTTRAESIVRAIDAGDRRGTASSEAPVTVTATRMITAAAPAAAVPAETANRLGQGYRRLAVTPRN